MSERIPIDMTGHNASEFWAATCSECGGRFRVDGWAGEVPVHQRTVQLPTPTLADVDYAIVPSMIAGYAERCPGSRTPGTGRAWWRPAAHSQT